jgi:rhamnogalacturonan endolyase
MFGTDPDTIAFNVYRNGTKVNASPITDSTNYTDTGGSIGSTYTVRPVLNGQEKGSSETASVWGQNYLDVPVMNPGGAYAPNDCSAADLDGDGQYEIIVKWEGATQDAAYAGMTDPPIIDGYKLNGKRLFRINLGKNIRGGAHYTQLMVYDLDGDGKAEIACKTADGTVDGVGNVIGDASKNYVNSDGKILDGPEFLTVFDGMTGKALSTVDYVPPRGSIASWGKNDGGNRCDRFLATIAYLDGVRPSLVMCRGYYAKLTMCAWDFRDGKLTKRWFFDSTVDNPKLSGQGNHNLACGDVDGDGKDEIIYGACAVDDNGKAMYSTGLGHGDAMHFTDIDPNRPGLEVWTCHESTGGADLHDAKTGEILFRWNASGDTGRCALADITADYPGCEMWASGSPLFSCTGKNIGSAPSQVNFAIWWDGDDLREILDGTTISKYGKGSIFSASGCEKINGTKSVPNLQADILGDWREEVIYRTSDNKRLRIFTTTATTNRRIYTLMHDPIYRLSIAWQNVTYNQPPYTGFFLGAGMAKPPVPNIYYPNDNPQTSDTPTVKPTNTPVPSNTVKPMVEDINGDRAVNIADVMLLAAHFNTSASDVNYDSKCDLNNDAAINISDVMMIASKFNYTY